MKHLLKTYEHEGITCDMRSSRKKFFPVMLDGKRIADVEKEKTRINGPPSFNFNILNGLDGDTYNDMFKIFSQISKDYNVEGIIITSTNKFPRYRRKIDEDGYHLFTGEREALFIEAPTKSYNDFIKHLNGKFMTIEHNDREYIIDEKEYNELIKNGCEINHPAHCPFSRILVGGEHIEIKKRERTETKKNKVCKFYIDDLSKLDSITFEDKIKEGVRVFLYFPVENMNLKNKIILPKIIGEGENTPAYFCFIDNKKCEGITLREDMFDFKNVDNYDNLKIHDDVKGDVLSFTVASPELKHENDLSL